MAKDYSELRNDLSYPPGIERDRESTAALISRLIEEVSSLFRKELALAKGEILEAASQWMNGAIRLAAGGVVLFAGILVLLAAIVLILAKVMPPWVAAFIVGGGVAGIGYGLMQSGKKKLEPSAFKPDRTQNAMRKDRQMVSRRGV
jgi:hypothetical protein